MGVNFFLLDSDQIWMHNVGMHAYTWLAPKFGVQTYSETSVQAKTLCVQN